jgi:hypothetical protein
MRRKHLFVVPLAALPRAGELLWFAAKGSRGIASTGLKDQLLRLLPRNKLQTYETPDINLLVGLTNITKMNAATNAIPATTPKSFGRGTES